MSNNYDIIIIDSGVNIAHEVYKNVDINTVNYKFNSENKIVVNNYDIDDLIGHGTAVFSIINKGCAKAKILNVKLFEKEMIIDDYLLLQCLEHLEQNYTSKIIHLSAGITSTIYKKALEEICNRISKAGTIIVCAFDNYGALSYPASFDSVIGVELSHTCKMTKDYIYIENSPVNLKTFGSTQKIPWLNNDYINACSNSFSAPYATCIIYNIIKNKSIKLDELKNILKANAKETIDLTPIFSNRCNIKINKAIVLPYNKEIHSLLRYSHLLNFQILEFYDHPKLLPINSSEFYSKNHNYALRSWERINWEDDFDTVILGHLRLLSNLFNEDYLKKFLDKCEKHNKNVFSFDSLKEHKDICYNLEKKQKIAYFPCVDKIELKENWMYKLPEISCPILGIFGTRKKQGKFTLQLEIRRKLLNMGYLVGQLGTEPSSELFGFDHVFPMGYDSTVETSGYDSIATIRSMMLSIENKNPDIIIVGSQSQTIPITHNNCLALPLYNYDFCLGTNPDGIILVINSNDDLEYIIKTINFLESITEGKVISLMLSNVSLNDEWSVLGNRINLICDEELNECKKFIEENVKLPVYLFSEIDQAVNTIITYFSD